MALRLLLDEHVPVVVARLLREHGVDALSLQAWREGAFLSRPDDEILRAAWSDERVLVTFDVSTVPAAIRQLSEANREHAGVLLISEKTIRQDDVGTLVRALAGFAAQYGGVNLRNQVLYLVR